MGPFRFFPKIRGDIRSSRCTTGVVDTGGKWQKSSNWKILIILFGYLWVVELTYTYIFAFKFSLRCLQPDIVPIICHRCRWYRWWTLTCEYLREFSKKFETVLMQYSRAGGKLIHQKNQKQKISWHCLFKVANKKRKFRTFPSWPQVHESASLAYF